MNWEHWDPSVARCYPWHGQWGLNTTDPPAQGCPCPCDPPWAPEEPKAYPCPPSYSAGQSLAGIPRVAQFGGALPHGETPQTPRQNPFGARPEGCPGVKGRGRWNSRAGLQEGRAAGTQACHPRDALHLSPRSLDVPTRIQITAGTPCPAPVLGTAGN